MTDAVKPSTTPTERSPMTVPRFVRAKQRQEKLAMLTGYDFLWAGILDESGVDAILVGDSLGMVVQGKSSTIPVTLDEIIYHAEMVCRSVKSAMVVVDLPFLTFNISPEEAIRNAGEIIKRTGAAAVKLEGGVNQAETIRRLTNAEIAVMAHVGMKPQSMHKYGGMNRIQRDREQLLNDAKAAADAGAFGIVLELIPREIAKEITETISIPTIGIGAGPDCDGQVLVTPDMLGLTSGFNPKYLKRFANLRGEAQQAFRDYVAEVRAGTYPDAEHSH
ncbi:MAG: 3-methyl-2-oxobutanoate hydroxymethyltransferase [Planctomycetota bacterium]